MKFCISVSGWVNVEAKISKEAMRDRLFAHVQKMVKEGFHGPLSENAFIVSVMDAQPNDSEKADNKN